MALESLIVASNINDFLKETNSEIEKLQAKQVKEAKKIVITAYAKVIDFSPVDTGLFISNHMVSINQKNNSTLSETDITKINKNKAILNRAKMMHGDTLYIQNNLDYADALEAGHSSQAKAGVYGVTEELIRKKLGKRIVIK